jgi:hypothetical protein
MAAPRSVPDPARAAPGERAALDPPGEVGRGSAGERAGLVRRCLRLPGPGRRLALRAALLMSAIRVALAVAPLGRVRGALSLRPGRSSGAAAGAGDVARAVARAGAAVPGATCLVRALALDRMLRARGHPARLVIGFARTPSGSLRGHAWVESGGAVFGGPDDPSRYAAAGRPPGVGTRHVCPACATTSARVGADGAPPLGSAASSATALDTGPRRPIP